MCRACNQKGHVEKVCKNKKQEEQKAQLADQQLQEEQLFVATCFAGNNSSEVWLIDSGCTRHMSNDKSIFKELDESYISKVRIGNGDCIDVKGKGDVVINTSSGIKIINDVLYVPEINQNLLSVGQLLEKGFSVNFKEKACEIFDPKGGKLFSVKMKGKSFSLDWEQANSCAHPNLANQSQLWHKRLGHFHYSAISFMHKNELVQGLPMAEAGTEVCEVCQMGKQSRLPFPQNKAWRATEELQLIHTDVCGPMKTQSLNGSIEHQFTATYTPQQTV